MKTCWCIAAVVVLFAAVPALAQVDLQVSSISDSPNDITLGTGDVQYFINLFNGSGTAATNASLAITLPASSGFVSATPTGAGGTCGAPVGGVVTCTWPTYPASASFSVTVTVTPGVAGTNTLSATISATESDPVPANNSDSENTTVNSQIDLAVSSISDSPNDITLGTGNVQYFINLFNYSTSKATNASLAITLPASSSFVSATPTGAGGACGAPVGGVVTCTWADYPASASFSVTVTVTPGVAGVNTLSATISATQPDPDNATAGHLDTDSENTTVNSQIDLAVSSISDSPNDITLGTGNVQYFINLFNYSTSKATNASLAITLPASSSFVSATPTGAGGACGAPVGGVVTCTWADYPASASFSVTVTVTPGVAGVNTLSATISATQPDPDNVTAGHLDTDSENTTVNSQIDLAVSSISDSPNDITLGTGNVQYFINLFNYSTSKATNASLAITLPASSSFVSATPTGAGGTCGAPVGGVVTCTWADYPSSASFSVTVTVTPGVAGVNTLSATISATQPDPDNATAGHLDTDSENTTVNSQIDLAVSSISDSPNDITLGTGNVQYFINLFNYSTSKATNASLAITLPASSSFVSATPTGAGGSCGAPVGGVVTCTWADYPASASFSVTVTVTPGAAGTNTLSATISATQPDPDNVTAGHLDTDSENTTVNSQIDLAVSSISDSPDPRTLGAGNVQYFINLFNYSTSKATNVSLAITLPASSGFISATPTGAGGTCGAPVGGVVTCTWADYPSSASFSVTVTVTPGVAGANTLTATISATQPDPDNVTPGHLSSDSETTTINPSSAPVITGFSPTSGAIGQPVTISGANFTGATSVKFFNLVTAAFTYVNDSTVTTTVPSGAATGVISMTNGIGTSSSGSNFTVTPGIVVTNTNDTGTGSLRDAIAQASSGACPAACTIKFSIGSGVQTIVPLSPLPNIAAANVTIDGTTQPGYSGTPLIEISGVSAGATSRGLVLAAGNATVRGLVIRNFTAPYPYGYAIYITSSNNTVAGNFLGTNAAGTAASPNRVGVVIEGAGVTGNTIGGLTASDRNLLSGNSATGVSIEYGPSNNLVVGNYIGTDVTGTADLGNAFNGVNIESANTNTIGGTSAAARNIISGNDSPNVNIWVGASANSVQGNYIGTDVTGTAALGDWVGVNIEGGATGNFVGGTTAGAGNVISGNGWDGVLITGSGTDGNFVQGNYAGIDAAGSAALPNGSCGIALAGGAKNNTVGGNSAGARNIASGNFDFGISIFDAGTDSNLVQGNYVGTNPAGSAAIPNQDGGIGIANGAQTNTVGGTSASLRNLISGNALSGVQITGAGTNANTVAGNYIGTDAGGTFIVANTQNGVSIENGAAANIIGGATIASFNVLSGNGASGVRMTGAGTSANEVKSNLIGFNAAGSGPLSNAGAGVRMDTGAGGNIVGSSGKGNKIAHNNKGVVLEATAGIGNRIAANSLHSNTAIGIDLQDDGITPNDATDNDTGPNNLQNFPVLGSATIDVSNNLAFTATLDSSGSSPSIGIILDVYKADASSPEQALTHLGSSGCLGATFTNTPISMSVTGVTAGNKIVATATSFLDGTCATVKDGTSEFSAAATVATAPAAVSISKSAPASVAGGQAFSYSITVSNAGPNTAFGLSVADTLPAGLVWSSTSAPGWSCSGPPNIVCTMASLGVTSSVITINVTAPASPGAVNNTATLSATNDSTGGDNSSLATTTVTPPSADLGVTKSPNFGTIALNGSVTYTITVDNFGPSPASAVVMNDPLPPGQTATTANSTQGTCTTGTNVSCSIGAMANGAQVTITIVATATSGGTQVNTATVSGTESDVNGANNSASATVTVTGSSTLVVTSSNDSGNGTLRQAILDANSGLCPAPCTIQFAMSPPLPIVTSPLPAITAQTHIDGTTQPGYSGTPLVHLFGGACITCPAGLLFSASQSSLRGLEISAMTGSGVAVTGAAGVVIRENSIHDNTGLGIDLDNDGPTNNDAGDADTGGNNRQNKPVLNSAILGGGNLFLNFSVDSTSVAATNSLRVDVFKADASGEGQVAAGTNCYAGRTLTNVVLSLPAGTLVAGNSIVATATSSTDGSCTTPSDGTSEFSAPVSAANCTTPAATITAPPSLCPAANGAASVAATAGATYVWSITNGTITGGAGTNAITFTAGASGTTQLGVTVTHNGCGNAGSANVTITPQPTANVSGSTAICAGGSTTISATLTGTAPFNITWSDSFVQTVSSGTLASRSVSPASNTAYSITSLSDANCSGTSSGSAFISVNPVPSAAVSGTAAICTGGSTTISATLTGTAPFNIMWSDGVPQVISSGTLASRAVSPATTTTYTITSLSDASCSGTSFGSAIVTVNPPPAVNITGPAATCLSAPPITLDAGPFASYSWSTGATTQTISVSPSSTTTYSVTVFDGNGCSASDSHVVTVSANPTATINAPAAVCTSSTGNSASVPAGASSYVWTITNGTITAGQNTNAITFSAGPSGVVQLGVTVTNGSCTSTGNANVPIQPPPAVTITGPTTACAGVPFTLDAGVFASYQWSTGATSRFLTITQSAPSATYSVIVTSGAGCTATDSHVVTSSPGADATIAAPASVNPFSTGHNASVPAQGGATYNWTIANGTITAGAGTNSITFSAGGSGSVDLGVTVTLGACSASGIASVFVGTPPPQEADFAIAKSAPASVQAGAALAYTIVVTNNGPLGATATMTDTLPAGLIVTSVSAGPWSCNTSAAQVACTGFLGAGTSTTITLNATAPAQGGTITNHASVISHLADPLAGNDSASAATVVVPANQNCDNAGPVLVAPVNGATLTNGNIQFVWSGIVNAIGYEVWLRIANGSPVRIGITTAAATSLLHTVPPGEYEWFVVAKFDACTPAESPRSLFEYVPPAQCADHQRPTLIAPLDDTIAAGAVDFAWNPPAGATQFEVYVIRGTNAPERIGTTGASSLNGVTLAPGAVRWFVRALFGQGCFALDSEERALEIVPLPPACSPLAAPVISAPGEISAGLPFLVQWSPVPGATLYELQLAPNGTFAGAQLITTGATSHEVLAPSSGAVFARVRALDTRCTPTPVASAYGPVSAIFVLPQQGTIGTVPLANPGKVQYTIVLGPEFAGQTFSAVPTEEWLTVSPASGTVAPGGTNLIVIADAGELGVGTSTGAIRITLNTASAGSVASHATTVIIPSISVNVVTPVKPATSNPPSADTMIIPGVANADGINSHFQSDVRVANTSPQLIKYQLTFIPSGEAGLSASRQTTFSIEPGRTVALDDVLKSWFGTGTQNAIGVLEIRPLTQIVSSPTAPPVGALANLLSFASSRTFNVTANGTFGQYIPAIPFANFIDKSKIISLQQISQSSKYRSNLALFEASGQPASVLIKVFGSNGQQITQFAQNLAGGQHTQLNSFLLPRGITLDDGRVEVSVTSATGKVTAVASVLDNQTSDAITVVPVTLEESGNTKWVVPGVADIRSGFANWQSDVRIFNANTTATDVTATFYSQAGGEPKVQTIHMNPGEVKQYDKALASLFGIAADGGALHLSTAQPSRIIATARTYNDTPTGTYGQFISAVTPGEAVGVGSRPLQILQVEESARMRSNVAFAEVTGKPVKLEVTVTPPDAKFSASIEVDLAANEFRQIGSILASTLGLSDTYNARISVRAIAGEGRALACASVIDLKTNDPTLIQAQ